MRGAADQPGGGVAPALLGAEPGPGEHLLRGGVTAAARAADATFDVERPAHGARALEHRPRLLRDVRDHADELVAGEGRQLLDANGLRERQLVGVVQPHRAQRDADHRRRGFEELEVGGLEAAAVVAHRHDSSDHPVGLGDRDPHHVAR